MSDPKVLGHSNKQFSSNFLSTKLYLDRLVFKNLETFIMRIHLHNATTFLRIQIGQVRRAFLTRKMRSALFFFDESAQNSAGRLLLIWNLLTLILMPFQFTFASKGLPSPDNWLRETTPICYRSIKISSHSVLRWASLFGTILTHIFQIYNDIGFKIFSNCMVSIIRCIRWYVSASYIYNSEFVIHQVETY